MRTRFAALALALTALAGCGPVQATATISDGEVALEKARTAQAQKYAIYNYTLAELYLHKAKEEAGYADFGTATELAEKAITNADLASQKSAKALAEQSGGGPNAPVAPMQVTPE